jgi:hypothetical protein
MTYRRFNGQENRWQNCKHPLGSLTAGCNITQPATSPPPPSPMPSPPLPRSHLAPPPHPTLDPHPAPTHAPPRLTLRAAAMQSGQQVLRSEQKNMEDVQRVREAILKGESVLMDSQVDFINRHTALLGEDGETAMGKIQQKARGPGCLPADIV